MNGVIYARYSEGPKQTDQSIEGQVADCRAFAEQNGITVVEVYADRHISGKSTDGRTEFLRMLKDAERHKFECVIVWKIDRFGRNRQDIAISKMKLKRAGVELKYAKESVPDGPEGIILESVLEGLAEYYSADLRQKVKRGIRESAKKGKYCGASVPIGYTLDADRHVIIDENTAPFVRKAFEMHIRGASLQEILDMMNRAGVKSTRGGAVTKAVLGRILRNERYMGVWELAEVPLDVPGIVSEEIFMEAQKHFKTSRNNAAGRANNPYLLSGKCFCGYCGSKIIGEKGTGRHGDEHYYYKCGGKKRGSSCELKPFKRLFLEDRIIEVTMQDMLTEETINYIADKVVEIQQKDQENDYVSVLKDKLADAEKRRKKLLRALELSDDDGDLSVVTERIKEISEEIKNLKGEIAAEEIRKPVLSRDLVYYWLDSFRDGDATDDRFRKTLVDTFIDHVEIKNEEGMIFFNISDDPHPRGSDTDRLVDLPISYPNPCVIGNYILLRFRMAA